MISGGRLGVVLGRRGFGEGLGSLCYLYTDGVCVKPVRLYWDCGSCPGVVSVYFVPPLFMSPEAESHMLGEEDMEIGSSV